ncbi:YbbR domain-containing protein [Alkalithermobacter thermoalcaliphilus JW-YL-7 = DSM 7308]|uniref:YbbR domain-containing protein n=1 Tax=Alkalithermobacter thermoalcaliphilus JW-YL-7 = DSM 7308 TaxID=1121328 RepID=A0A150FN01_CLOPD|nr:YbbR family protein [[Clostridium] paradoxum JW-YL-7 = DSM 7308]SHL35991.1 YbbR domain-containing protein [[Clostridium] paradoxum JW-YL-7 = DSM 7308]
MINIFKNNLKIKLLSLFLAFIMWIYVMVEADPIVIRDFNDIPVRITNIEQIKEKGMTISYDSDLKSNIVLRGRRSLFKDITKDKISLYGQIENPKLGENIVNIKASLPENIEYTIMPEKLGVILEQNVVIRKEIDVQKSGRLKEGVKITDINISPKSTWIEGPKSIVNKVDKLVCRLNLDNKDSDFNVRTEIVPLDKQGNVIEGINLKDRYAYLNVSVSNSKRVPIKVNLTGKLDEDYKLISYNISNDTVVIYGKQNELDKVKEIYTSKIDISNIREDKKIIANLEIPPNIQASVKDIEIEFKVSKLITKDFHIPKSRIIFNNIQNLDISKNNLPENILVKVVYLEELAGDIDEKDIQIFVNMQDDILETSKYEIKYNIPYPVERVDVVPRYVEIYK